VAGDQGAGGGLIVSLVAAVGRNRALGANGGLPWRLSSDLKRFRALTMGKPLIMGRKTFDSIGRPLPGRDVIVVTRDPGWTHDGVRVARNLEEALGLMKTAPGEIYRLAWDRADRLYLTQVDLAPEADVLFPVVDPADWLETRREAGARGPKDEADFVYIDYERRRRGEG
jgi:dihydrofolate reductase